MTIISIVNYWLKCMMLDPYNQTDNPKCKSRPDADLSAITKLDPSYITAPLSSVWRMQLASMCRTPHNLPTSSLPKEHGVLEYGVGWASDDLLTANDKCILAWFPISFFASSGAGKGALKCSSSTPLRGG
ncbi:hypothetical protein SUGI_0048270 [Cryptomeria japonica]|nr:hypothetical protein SUGI_0048270 [Cryptomeria japonica]